MDNIQTLYTMIGVVIVLILPFLGDYFYKKFKEKYKRNIIYNENNKDSKFEDIYSNINNNDIKVIEDKIRNAKEIKEIKEYDKRYKSLLLSNLVKSYDKAFIYKPDIEDEEHLKLRNEYYENGFSIGRQGKIDLLNVQNCIYGKIDNTTQMSLYDISVELVNGAYSYIAEGKYSEFKQRYDGASVFKGTYIILDINKKIPTFVRITKNKYIQIKNKVELDSSEFEKYFDVNSDDKILATRILTADVMQMLVDFYKKYNIKFEIVLKENKIYINLHTAEAFNIPKYKRIDKQQIYLYYAILEFATNLSKEINKALNQIEL